MEVHDKIRTLRELNQWSQEEMAEKLDITPSGYAKIERGESELSFTRLQQIAHVFNMDVLELLKVDKNIILKVQINKGDSNNCNGNLISIYTKEADEAAEIEKLKLVITHQAETIQSQKREMDLLRDMLDLMKKQQGNQA